MITEAITASQQETITPQLKTIIHNTVSQVNDFILNDLKPKVTAHNRQNKNKIPITLAYAIKKIDVSGILHLEATGVIDKWGRRQLLEIYLNDIRSVLNQVQHVIEDDLQNHPDSHRYRKLNEFLGIIPSESDQ